MVTNIDVLDAIADVDDNATRLVTADEYLVDRPITRDEVQVGMADPDGPDLDTQFAAPDRTQLQFLDAQRLS